MNQIDGKLVEVEGRNAGKEIYQINDGDMQGLNDDENMRI